MSDKAKEVSKSIALFVAAGLCEIGGGWLVWKWRKADWHWGYFILGSAILVLYGFIPTLQDQVFGRVYAAYGGFFILLSFAWAWAFDGERPDLWDIIGSAIAVAGVCLIMFMPRKLHHGVLKVYVLRHIGHHWRYAQAQNFNQLRNAHLYPSIIIDDIYKKLVASGPLKIEMARGLQLDGNIILLRQ